MYSNLVEIQQDCDRSLQISISSLTAIQTPYSIILTEKEYNPTFLRTSTNEKGDFQPTSRYKMRVYPAKINFSLILNLFLITTEIFGQPPTFK
jgi:hypothetical protein